MSLKFANIEDVYPNWNNCSSSSIREIPVKLRQQIKENYTKLPVIIEESEEELPKYTEYHGNYVDNEFNELKELKPYQKLRKLNDKLVIDTRIILPSIRRYFTKDNRNLVLKELEILLALSLNNIENLSIIYNTIEILKTSTYKKDSKWVDAANLVINSRFII